MDSEKILVLCPSRGRPALCNKMVDSFNATAKRSSLRLLLDVTDPCIDEYRDLLGKKVGNIIIDQQKPITQLINQSWNCPSSIFKYLSVTNDDFLYKTDGWDEKFVETLDGRIGIVYGNDLAQGVNMPTCSTMSREIPEALGWLQMPRLTHLFGDTVWQMIGKEAKCLFYRPDVIIEHCHFFAKKADQDDIYKRTNSGQMYDLDTKAFLDWRATEARADIDKVKSLVVNNHQNGIPSR
jgi:hypothetical protein